MTQKQFEKRWFELTEDTLSIIEEIGGHMPGGFFIYKAEDPEELIYANKAVFDIYGCSGMEEFKELTGFTFKGLVHPDDYDSISSSIVQQINTSEDGMDYAEYRIIRKDGEVRWVDDYGHYCETKAYGGVYVVFISDITEKAVSRSDENKKQEQQKKELNSMITAMASDYRSVYHVDIDADDAVCFRADSSDPNQTPEGVHFPFLARFRDYCEMYVDDEYKEGFLKFIDPDNVRFVLATENIMAYRYLAHRGGAEYYEMLRMAGVRHPADRDDNIVHAVGLGFTVIDDEMREAMARNRELAEALAIAEDASKAKTTFLSNMSHEIRTPLNAIIGLDNIALNDPNISEGTRDYLEKIGVSAHHLLGIINDILDMSRIESGRMVIKSEEFSFAETLSQVNTIISGQCKDKGLNYEYKIKGNIRDYYIGDDMKLGQVLINILGNAVKFTPPGGNVYLTVEEAAHFDSKSVLRFTIRDTGIGMSKDYLPVLFDPFTQEDSSVTNKYGSTGLGMPITKSIIELMNGHIKVDSEKGKGTTFTVTITLPDSGRKAESDEPGEALKKAVVKDEAADLTGRRILLAEDMPVNTQIMKMILSMREMIVDHAENGQVAVDKFAEHEPGYYAAILMDMRMPVMDGLEATRTIRAMDRDDAGTVPIIAMTANAFDEDVQRSMQAGLNAHLSKPVEPEDLFRTLEGLVQAR